MTAAPQSSLISALDGDLAARRAAGLWRVHRTLDTPVAPRAVIDGRAVVAFSSNDYLGLAADPRVVAALREGAERWGAGAGASHLLGGHTVAHAALESLLAAFVAPAPGAGALTFSSGWLANLALLTALAGRDDAIFADRLNHACLNDGALLSRARFVRYPHGDVGRLAEALARTPARRRLIVTDGVFSMDGDVAPLVELFALAERHDAWLVVDDAHGFGVLGEGRGSVAAAGLASDRIVVMGTLGKAAGVAGAFVAAHRSVIETLVQTARPYIYTTAAPPALAHALATSVAVIRDDDARRGRLFANVARFRAGMATLPWRLVASATAIQPVIVGSNTTALALADGLWRRGFYVPAIRPPTVPAGSARLRVSLSAAHTDEDVDNLLAAFAALAPAYARDDFE